MIIEKTQHIDDSAPVEVAATSQARRKGWEEVFFGPLERPAVSWTLLIGVLTSVMLIFSAWIYPPGKYELFLKYEPQNWEIGYNCLLSLTYGLLTGYVATLIMISLPKWLGRVWMGVCVLLAWIDMLIDAGCHAMLQRTFSRLFVEILGGTDPEEVDGFFLNYFNWEFVYWAVGATALGVAVWCLGRLWMPRRLSAPTGIGVIGLMVCSALALWVAGPTWMTGLSYKIGALFDDFYAPQIQPANPKLEPTRNADESPELLIVIFGESLSSSHCSLYGYDKPTQPLLGAIDSCQLRAFGPANSVGLYTTDSFRQHMSTFDKQRDDDCAWYSEPNIIECARLAGYRTLWVSNQSKAGRFDNVMARFAQFSDEAYFTREDAWEIKPEDSSFYDENILPLLAQHLPAEGQKAMVMVHLMGSHPAYSLRYPKNYNHFKVEEYADRPEHQRHKLRYYDNSVLYNDMIVDSIIKMTEGRKAMVVYFSDHGSDLYETNANYAGHPGKTPESKAAGRKVPMIIYMSPELRESAPELAARFDRAGQHEGYNTTNFIYTINDILGQRFADRPNGPSVLDAPDADK